MPPKVFITEASQQQSEIRYSIDPCEEAAIIGIICHFFLFLATQGTAGLTRETEEAVVPFHKKCTQ